MHDTKKYLRRAALGLTYIIMFVLIFCIIVNLIMVYQSFKRPGELPEILGYKFLISKTDSMSPSIDSGDLVMVREAPAGSLKLNEIIAFKVKEAILVQRINEIDHLGNKPEIKTKADQLGYDSFNIAENAIEGILVLRIPKLGNALIFIQTPIGTITFVLLPVLVMFAIYSILARRKTEESPKKRL